MTRLSTHYCTLTQTRTFDEEIFFKCNDYHQEFKNEDECLEFYDKNFKNTEIGFKDQEIFDKVNFGHGIKKYEFQIYNIRNNTSLEIQKNKWFLVSKELLSEQDIKLLLPYCKCQKCTALWGLQWTYCGCCTGCIDNIFGASDYVIKKTREYKEESDLIICS